MIPLRIKRHTPFSLTWLTHLYKSIDDFYITKRCYPLCPKDPCCNIVLKVDPCVPKKVPPPSQPCCLDPFIPQPKVIIIGAGLAGLSAANRLSKCGFKNFQVIEATDRPGGRIQSCWLGDEVGELGAGWINGATLANPMYALGAQEGLLKNPLMWRRKPPIEQIPHLTSDGKSIDNFVTIPAVKLFRKIKQQAFSLYSMDNTKDQGSLHEFFQTRLADQLVSIPADWRHDASRVIWGMINGLNSRWGTRVDSMSSDMYGSFISYPGDALRIPVGLIGILAPLLKSIPAGQVRYCSPVQEIRWKGCSPRVSIRLGDECVTGDYAIVTTSLGVLKNLSGSWFSPPLPDWKECAINNIGYGKLIRVIMEYKQPFWLMGEGIMRICWSEAELDSRDSWTKGIAEIEDVPGSSNKLMTTIGGYEAEMVQGCSDEDIAEEITRIIRKFTGNPSIPFPTGIVKSKWNCSPYFMGANSYLAQGSSVNDQCNLATPLPGPDAPGPPVVLFAGEATAPGHISSLLGAHLSGVREADRILKLTKKYKGPPPEEHTNS